MSGNEEMTKIDRLFDEARSVIKLCGESSLDDYFDIVERMDTTPLDKTGCIKNGLLTALDTVDLAIYRHPAVAEDLKIGFKVILLALIEAGAHVVEFDQTERIEEAVRSRLSAQGRHAANCRHAKPGGTRELRDKIRTIWSSGKYKSRDLCAEQEWAELGFGSFKTARKALINTPPPSCAQWVPSAK
jgi:hypothetical protein